MKKERKRGGIPLALAVNTAAFGLGGLGGFFLAGWLSGRGVLSFSGWLESYALGLYTHGAATVSFWAVLWDAMRWPLFLALLGFTALGVWMVPTMFALRGFFLCFGAAALSGTGRGGLLLALVLWGLGNVIGLPAFFLLGVQSWEQARAQDGRLFAPPAALTGGALARTGLILGCVAGGAWIGRWLTPGVLNILAPLLGGA